MKQFQITKEKIADVRLVQCEVPQAGSDEILLKVERFGLSANNITYAVAGDTLGYWQFFQPLGEGTDGKGLMPVWGFAEIVESNAADLPVGERIFGYFPPANFVVMKPEGVTPAHFFDSSKHRAHLPKGYNIYRRVEAEPGYDRAGDDFRMLLYPLYVTSFVIADQLEEFAYYDAENVFVISASSKTSIGLAYALEGSGKHVIGLTSRGNREFVESLGAYDEVVCYDDVEAAITKTPSAIVDMAGNAELLGQLHMHLGNQMMRTLSVGLTHWESERRSSNVIKDRTEFFFAPARIQQRMKEWGAEDFNKKSGAFLMEAVGKSSTWLNLKTLSGLDGLTDAYPAVLEGKADPRDGLLIEM
ncbi:MAG: DUF2855 family protein [Rhizobiaceae bacterium]|nr:DUF2855 family protein [Rhizobiaceae bacterium]